MKTELFKLKMTQGQDWIDLIIFEDLTVRLDSSVAKEKVASVFPSFKRASDALLIGAEEFFKEANNATADR